MRFRSALEDQIFMVLRKYVGGTVRRKEDPRLITGSSTYVDDLKLPNMVHVAIVRSTYPHAEITGIDASAALEMPGVIRVLTADDLKPLLPGKYSGVGSGAGPAAEGGPAEDDGKIPVPGVEPLASSRVRHVGEPIAAVVAETRLQAIDAAEAVVVEYTPLPALVDPYEARQDGAPLIYDTNPNNISTRQHTVVGNADAAFASAPVKVKAKIRATRCHPVPMETRGCVAAKDGITGGLTIWVSNQGPHGFRNEVASAFGFNQNQVRTVAPEVGGGFGAKFGVYPEDYVVCAAALLLDRPVKWIESRSEHFLVTNHGRNQIGEFEVGADTNGKLLSLKGRVILDSGSYPKGLGLAWGTWVMSQGPYHVPDFDFMVEGVYTNTGVNGAYRGAGRPEATFYLERLMDMVADEAGLDPLDVRRVNFIQPDEFPFTTHTGEHYDTGEYEKPMDRAMELFGYAELRKEQE
ncbi:MAG: xanthine dehydrogenase family protein molybdopterin-binding subunit, partial [Chloroflexota bacterium]|nr:xanthine dehydrogenase family protein molybdopterin-binding subunit [Chloroflexota bacterium]